MLKRRLCFANAKQPSKDPIFCTVPGNIREKPALHAALFPARVDRTVAPTDSSVITEIIPSDMTQ
jgi:hypothetical protein